MLLLDTGARGRWCWWWRGWKKSCDNRLLKSSAWEEKKKKKTIRKILISKLRAADDVHLMLSAASSAVFTGYSMCGCVLAFPSPTPFFPPG